MSEKAAENYRDHLAHVRTAALRGADLTRQLLAFARKQSIQPRRLDLNESVGTMVKLLQRLAGENVQLEWRPDSGPAFVCIDPSQLDQLLANLVVNARDAVSGRGTISISTRLVEEQVKSGDGATRPASYVLLSVSDDGCGMSPETLGRIFEPFFTTKPDGQGTGLGLATVHGIVHQNGGFIKPVSQVGKGATFQIYLPQCKEGLVRGGANAPGDANPSSGSETVLLVDDQVDFRDACARILEILGYNVLTAQNGLEAMEIFEAYADRIDLLITDVVMTGMNGNELWQQLHTLRPDLRCLFMSGYTADVLSEGKLLEENVQLIAKPFSTRDLGEKIREVFSA